MNHFLKKKNKIENQLNLNTIDQANTILPQLYGLDTLENKELEKKTLRLSQPLKMRKQVKVSVALRGILRQGDRQEYLNHPLDLETSLHTRYNILFKISFHTQISHLNIPHF
jgi:hypothetical protein